jgi:hypothetical protein
MRHISRLILLVAAIVAVDFTSTVAAAAGVPPQCIPPNFLTPTLLGAYAELNAGQYIPAVADFDTQAANSEACAAGWCDGVDRATGRIRAEFAYIGAGAAYFALGEPDIATSALDHAVRSFDKLAADAKTGAEERATADLGRTYEASVRNAKQALVPVFCKPR